MPAGYSGDSRYFQQPRQPLQRRQSSSDQADEEDENAFGILMRSILSAKETAAEKFKAKEGETRLV